MLTISFANSKGGVGKSTACLCIAGAYAKTGSKVHIIDLDSNGTVSRWLSKGETPPSGITASKADPQELSVELQKVARNLSPDLCLIDLPGSYEVALSIALFRSHLTLLPVCPSSEADIFESIRVVKHIKALFAKYRRAAFFRILLTKYEPLTSLGQVHGMLQLRNTAIPLLETRIWHRAGYKEIGFSGLPPHFAPVRDTTAKAVQELNRLKAELDRLLDLADAPSDSIPELDKAEKSA